MLSLDDAILAAAACIILANHHRAPRRHWVKPSLLARSTYSGNALLNDLQRDDSDPLSNELRCEGSFKNFLRITSPDFELLITAIGHRICKKETNFRKPITVRERVAVTMRYLATGDSYASLSVLFKISKSTISQCVPEVCEALIDFLKDNIKLPKSKEEWLHHAEEYNRQWNFPHCLGSLDGKHVMIQAPMNTGSEYFNYKGLFSIVLLAVVDAHYCFTYVSVGCQGRISDGGVFAQSSLCKLLKESSLNIPEPCKLPGRYLPVPFVFVADDAFPLQTSIMKPFPGLHDKVSIERIYNYRLSRARRVVENAFGILSVVFRVLRKPILLEPENAERVVLACVHLHNFLRRSESSCASYTPSGSFDYEDAQTESLVPGQWRVVGMPRETLLQIKRIPKKPSKLAMLFRDEFGHYFKSPMGSVSWQEKY